MGCDLMAIQEQPAIDSKQLNTACAVPSFSVPCLSPFLTPWNHGLEPSHFQPLTTPSLPLSLVLFTSGNWKEKKFKPYNFEALGVAPDCGHLHPLLKVRTQFRQIFLEMG